MLADIIKERRRKLKELEKEGVNPYPSKIKISHSIKEALENFGNLSASKKKIFLAGRMIGFRDQGNLVFIDFKDESGKIQAVFKKDNLKNFKLLKETLDVGDFISVAGPLFTTKKGEKSVEAKEANIIVKSILPLPDKWYGLKDTEERFRKRYLDIILNPEVKETISKRSEIVRSIRESLHEEGFMEVETPMLQALPGGAKARPFITRHNALNVDFYLRIAPELYLKRLLVGGFEKIFEIGRNFRNEGVDREHNPEFTMLELYWAYQDWRGLMKFTEKILKKFIPGKYEEITYADAFKKYAKKDLKKIKFDKIDEIFKKEVRPKIINPTFLTYYPKSISPLAKSSPENPELTERFQLIVNAMEVVNGFSELNDPIEQRKRMEEQEKMFRSGDEESPRLDNDFLEALEYGMPPAAGLGIGIDRLVSLITKTHNLKEVIIFPTLRPK
jgi:lysyl-tRNA synthetase class 2